MLYKLFRNIQLLITPKSTNKDKARKEFILNVILSGVIVLSFIGFTVNLFYFLFSENYQGNFPIVSFAIVLLFCILFLFSKIGQVTAVSITFVSFLLLSSFLTSIRWGTDLPQTLLMYALIIIMSGILVGSRFLLVITLTISTILTILAYLQINNVYIPETNWRTQPFKWGDSIVRVVTLIIIGLISWLFENQISKALNRAHASELAVLKEKDLLELKVKERTEELKQAQVEKLAQLYHFAEVGRYASGLFHDLVNPLTLVSLNLSKLKKESHYLSANEMIEARKMIQRALMGTKRLQEYIETARKQIKNIEQKQKFLVSKEINQTIKLLWHKIDQTKIKIVLPPKNKLEIYGNAIKFNQVIMNLLLNAIDAYNLVSKKAKIIKIHLTTTTRKVNIIIQDWGMGIDEYNFDEIFKPLFTTKHPKKGTGLGLFISKNIIEKDFKGTISFHSEKGEGTTFIITIPVKTSKI